MSYCRWSSDDFQCDVYCYESGNLGVGSTWVTHVAAARLVFKTPLPPKIPLDRTNPEPWIARYKLVMDAVGAAERVPIGLAHDGETFDDETPGKCADRLERLRSEGYLVPQYAIDELRKEEAERIIGGPPRD